MRLERQIRYLIILFMTGLIVSGITAFPIETQLIIGKRWFVAQGWNNEFTHWIDYVHEGVLKTNEHFPFIAYGTDWLAFAHLVIATAFIGPLRDPVRNIWVIQFGMIACLGIFPLAMIAGAVRSIPIFWRLIDCSFGIFGGILLWICYQKIIKLEKLKTSLA